MKPLDLEYNAIKAKIYFMGFVPKDLDKNNWPHFSWNVVINGVSFAYKTGIGHCSNAEFPQGKKPKDKISFPFDLPEKINLGVYSREYTERVFVHVPELKAVLSSLLHDSESANESFDNWCSSLGYDTDSRKALDMYLACQDAKTQLRLAKVELTEEQKEELLNY